MSLERYRSIIPDWDGFLATVRTPEPTTFRVRPGRMAPDALQARLAAKGFTTRAVEGLPDFLRVEEGPYPVSLTLEHWQGLFYVQQTVTGVAPPALAPRPGERVLDMCASPGGKTTHVADLMGLGGCLVAADVNEGRLRGLQGNLTRLLVPNVVTVVADGRRFPGGALFDRILVDAPCSAEGNLRKKLGRLRDQKPSFLRHVNRLQEGILSRAAELVRPGGTILYVTCTFAPEENEAVVGRVLQDTSLEVVRVDLPVPSSPGLTSFEGTSFPPSLELAHRLYPHHLDSGGLFLVALRKPGDADRDGDLPGWSPVPTTFPGDPVPVDDARAWIADGVERLQEQFGVDPDAMSALRWMVRGDNGWMHGCETWPVPAWKGTEHRIPSVGLRALSPDARDRPRPTNSLLRWLGPRVTRRLLALDPATVRRVLRREAVAAPDMTPGHAALCVEELVVGRVSVGAAGIRHEIPKARAGDLLKALEAGRA